MHTHYGPDSPELLCMPADRNVTQLSVKATVAATLSISSLCSLSIKNWFLEVPVKHCQFSCSAPSTGFQGWWCCWSRRAVEPGCLPGSHLGPSLWASLWPEETAEWMTAKTPARKWSHYWMNKHHMKMTSFLPCGLQKSSSKKQDLKERPVFLFFLME